MKDRFRRDSEYSHGEAYCRMEYAGKFTNQVIVIWNSRDGVTPFCAHIDGIEYQHINWPLDQRQRHWVPAVGDYIFMDCDYATWEAQEKAQIERDWDSPDYPISSMGMTKEDTLVEFMKSFQPGQPMTVKVTQEIHDHFKEKAGDNAPVNPSRSLRPPYRGPTRFA